MDVLTDPILMRFRSALLAQYGRRVERALLFGSRARGDARADSDYDIAVFLMEVGDRWSEMQRLAAIGTDILDETGEFVQALPYPAEALQSRTMLMHEIRKDGRDIL